MAGWLVRLAGRRRWRMQIGRLAGSTFCLPRRRHTILREWNDTARALAPHDPCPSCLPPRFAKTPDAVAVVFEERTLSYGDLDRRAQSAGRIICRASASARRTVVGLCVEALAPR